MNGDALDSTLTERPMERQTSRRLHIEDKGSLHHYRTEIPNTIIRGRMGRGLSVYAKCLYDYLKSVAGDRNLCFQSTATIAHQTEMSVGRVHKAKYELAQRGLISITHGPNPRRHADRIRIEDIWPANTFEFSQRARQPEEEACEPQEQPSQVATTPDAAASIHTANTEHVPELAQAPDEPADDAAVFTTRTQCSPGEYSVHQVNGRRSQEEDLLKKTSEKEGEGSARAPEASTSPLHATPPVGYTMPQGYEPPPALVEQITRDCPHLDVLLTIKACRVTTFRRPILDPNLRLHKFCLEEEERARDRIRRSPTRAAPQPLLD